MLPLFGRGLNWLRGRIRKSLHEPTRNYHSNPYTTHLPVLAGLANITKIERVVELGCGTYSTLSFLNLQVFPDIKELRSFENDFNWVEKIGEMVKNDDRAELKYYDLPMHQIVETIDFRGVDLVFIDDSFLSADRAKTIEKVLDADIAKSIVVVHDFERTPYQQASSSALFQHNFTAYYPNTGVLWFQKNLALQKKLKLLAQVINKNSLKVMPDDLSRWVQIFEEK